MASKEIRPIRVEGNIAYVPLTQGYEAIIDAADVPLIDGFNWHAQQILNTVYAKRNVSRHADTSKCGVYLHRAIMAPTDDMQVDHVNGDGLDNRRTNLRLASKSENGRNARGHADSASGVKGVSPRNGKWLARIRHNGREVYLGRFATIDEAAAAYAQASVELHGQFGRAG